MNRRAPSLRFHHGTGQWFAKWGNRFHYFGTDRSKAKRDFLSDTQRGLPAWVNWRRDRDDRIRAALRPSTLLIGVAEQFMRAKSLETQTGGSYYRTQLRLFLHAYGGLDVAALTPQHLQALKEDMLRTGYAPKTVNHHLIAAKALLGWAADMGLCAPIRLRGVKVLALGEAPSRAFSMPAVRNMVWLCADANVRSWLAVNYLTLARPIEVCRLVNGQGEWESTGVFRLAVSKVERRTGRAKRLVVSDEALDWLKTCEPRWKVMRSYHQGVRWWFRHPGRLRHSAATHLIHEHGVDRLSVEALLGHSSATNRVSTSYAQTAWPRLRQTAALLTLQSCAWPRSSG